MIYFDKENHKVIHLFRISNADIIIILEAAKKKSVLNGDKQMPDWLDLAEQDIVYDNQVNMVEQNDECIRFNHGNNQDELSVSNMLGDIKVGINRHYYITFKGSELNEYYIPLEDKQ